jgi:hypothetical protein
MLHQNTQPAMNPTVIYRPVAELKPDPSNARIHKPRQINLLANSIQAFGFNVPVLVDASLNVISGHGRLLACQKLGITEVPTISLEHLTPEQVKAFAIADNRLSEISVWDDQLLASQLKALAEVDLSFDIEATGFSIGEIDLRIESLDAEQETDAADAIIEPAGPAVTIPGDLWQLGEHRIYCGNSLEEVSYQILLGDLRAAMAFSDAPFNVPIHGHVGGKGAIRHREFAMASGEMSEEQFTVFLTTVFTLMATYSKPGSVHFQCMDWRHAREILAAGDKAYSSLLNLCVWVKGQGGMGSLYRSRHEMVFVFKHGQGRHQNNVELGRFGRYRTNVWEYAGIHGMRHGEEGDLLALHPTVKPVRMVADAIFDCSSRGDIVLDAFLGSGTTLLAAERTGRKGYGIEMDPLYVDTAIRRWQNFTGQDAIHVASGQNFTRREQDAQAIFAALSHPDKKEVRHG